MIDGTTPDNFIVNRGGYNCGHELIPVSEARVPKELRGAIEIQQNLKNLSQTGRKGMSGLLYSDITGGIATSIAKLVTNIRNNVLDNKDKNRELSNIINNTGFAVKLRNNETKTITKIYGTVKNTDVEYKDNLNGAKSLNKNGYDVYILPKVPNSKSPDYLLVKKNWKFLAELKTIYGKNSLDRSLTKAKSQADRIVLNIVGNITSRNAAETIKTFYENNPQINEIIVLKGGKEINIFKNQVSRKRFVDEFMKHWAR